MIHNNAAYLEVEASVRYWEDAIIDGIEDENGSLIPLRRGGAWCPIISLEFGKILNWPVGVEADIHYKVCDAGEYWLLNEDMDRIGKWRGSYVPDKFLCHGNVGYGDYIIFKVNGSGMIFKWVRPDIYDEDWDVVK